MIRACFGKNGTVPFPSATVSTIQYCEKNVLSVLERNGTVVYIQTGSKLSLSIFGGTFYFANLIFFPWDRRFPTDHPRSYNII